MQSDVPGGSDPGPIFKGVGGRIRIRFFFLRFGSGQSQCII